jgi:hypothetical protein
MAQTNFRAEDMPGTEKPESKAKVKQAFIATASAAVKPVKPQPSAEETVEVDETPKKKSEPKK